MLFRYFYPNDKDYSISGYDAHDDFRNIMILFMLILVGGVFVIRYISFAIVMFILLFAVLYLFPLPISPVAVHLILLPFISFSCESILSTGYSKGSFRTTLIVLVPLFFYVFLWLFMDTYSFNPSVYSCIDCVGTFLYLFAGGAEETKKIRITIALILGGIGVLIAVVDTIRIVTKDERFRKIVLMGIISFVIGFIPIIVVVSTGYDAAVDVYSYSGYVFAMLIFYSLSVLVVNAFLRESASFRIVCCSPILVPILVAMSISALSQPESEVTLIPVSTVAIELSKSVRDMGLESKLASLTGIQSFSAFVALARMIEYSLVVFAVPRMLKKREKKDYQLIDEM